MEIYTDLLKSVRKIYQHEQCPKVLRGYIRFEMGKYFSRDIDVKGFLEGDD